MTNNKLNKTSKRIIIIAAIVMAAVLISTIIGVILHINSQNSKNKPDCKQIYNDYKEINEEALAIEEKYAIDGFVKPEDVHSVLDELEDVAKEYKSKGLINSYDKQATSIYFKLNSGIGYLYTPTVEELLAGDDVGKILTIEPYAINPDFVITYLLSGKSPDKVAKEIVADLPESYSFSEDDNWDSFSFKDVDRMDNHKIIIWYGHGGYVEEHGPVLGTSVLIDRNSIFKYWPKLRNGEIILAKESFCVTPSFFDNKLEDNSLEGSLVFLDACESAMDNRLADVFINKGAGLVVGNSRTIHYRYMLDMMYDFMSALTNQYDDGTYWTAEDALAYAKSQNGDSDIELFGHGAEVKLIYPEGKKGYRLYGYNPDSTQNDMTLDNEPDSSENSNIIKDEAQALQIAEDLIKRYETYNDIGTACDVELVDGEEGRLIWDSLAEEQKNYLSTPYKCLCCKTYDEAMEHTQNCIASSVLEQPLEVENYIIYNDSLYFFPFNRGSLVYKNIRVDKFSENRIIAFAEKSISYDNGFNEMQMFTIESVDDYFKITDVSEYDINNFIKNYNVDSNAKQTLTDKYGIASEKEFVSCLGPDIQEYPSSINGIISIQCADIDYDGNGEIVLLRVKNPKDNNQEAEIIAEVYNNDNGKLILTATQSIYDVSYCFSSNIYLYHSKTLNQYCIMVDYRSAGGYTGVNCWGAKVYTISNDSINAHLNLEFIPSMGSDVNFESSLGAIDAPYAKYCTDFDNRNNASYYQNLCEIEHEIFGDSSTYLTRNHKLLINGNIVE